MPDSLMEQLREIAASHGCENLKLTNLIATITFDMGGKNKRYDFPISEKTASAAVIAKSFERLLTKLAPAKEESPAVRVPASPGEVPVGGEADRTQQLLDDWSNMAAENDWDKDDIGLAREKNYFALKAMSISKPDDIPWPDGKTATSFSDEDFLRILAEQVSK